MDAPWTCMCIYIFFIRLFFFYSFFFFSHEAVGGSRRAASLHSRYLINIGAEGNDVLASAILFFRFLKFSYVHRKSGGKQIFLFFFSPPFFFPSFFSIGGEQWFENPGRVTSLRTFFEPRFRAQPVTSRWISFLLGPRNIQYQYNDRFENNFVSSRTDFRFAADEWEHGPKGCAAADPRPPASISLGSSYRGSNNAY